MSAAATAKGERERIESRLRWYPILKRRIESTRAKIRKRRAELCDEGYSLQAMSFNGIPTQTNRITQREQDYVAHKLEPDEELGSLRMELRRLEAERDEIRAGLGALSEQQQEFVRLRYFKQLYYKQVAVQISVSETTVYELRNSVLDTLLQAGL